MSATDCNARSLCAYTIALSLLLEGRAVHRDMHDHLLGLRYMSMIGTESFCSVISASPLSVVLSLWLVGVCPECRYGQYGNVGIYGEYGGCDMFV